MNNTVLVSGGTGFIGRYVTRVLRDAGTHVRLLSRSTTRAGSAIDDEDVHLVPGDVTDADSLTGCADGCTAIIHLVGIIEEKASKGITFDRVHRVGAENMIEEARRAGVPTFVHMSANGAREDGVSGYQTSKWAAENAVKQAGFEHWSIFRPSLVFGPPSEGDDEFCSRLVSTMLRPLPVWPVFGSGEYPFAPVSVEDLARALVAAAVSPPRTNRSFCVAGPEEIPFKEVIKRIAAGAGLTARPILSQPLWLVRPAIRALSPTGLLPISVDQLDMLVEGNACNPDDYVQEFGIDPTGFTPENLSYLQAD